MGVRRALVGLLLATASAVHELCHAAPGTRGQGTRDRPSQLLSTPVSWPSETEGLFATVHPIDFWRALLIPVDSEQGARWSEPAKPLDSYLALGRGGRGLDRSTARIRVPVGTHVGVVFTTEGELEQAGSKIPRQARPVVWKTGRPNTPKGIVAIREREALGPSPAPQCSCDRIVGHAEWESYPQYRQQRQYQPYRPYWPCRPGAAAYFALAPGGQFSAFAPGIGGLSLGPYNPADQHAPDAFHGLEELSGPHKCGEHVLNEASEQHFDPTDQYAPPALLNQQHEFSPPSYSESSTVSPHKGSPSHYDPTDQYAPPGLLQQQHEFSPPSYSEPSAVSPHKNPPSHYDPTDQYAPPGLVQQQQHEFSPPGYSESSTVSPHKDSPSHYNPTDQYAPPALLQQQHEFSPPGYIAPSTVSPHKDSLSHYDPTDQYAPPGLLQQQHEFSPPSHSEPSAVSPHKNSPSHYNPTDQYAPPALLQQQYEFSPPGYIAPSTVSPHNDSLSQYDPTDQYAPPGLVPGQLGPLGLYSNGPRPGHSLRSLTPGRVFVLEERARTPPIVTEEVRYRDGTTGFKRVYAGRYRPTLSLWKSLGSEDLSNTI